MYEKAHIGKLFDGIAHTYDKFNHFTSMGIDILWRKKAVKGMRPVDTMLDVAIGTADMSIIALKKGKAKKVEGLDLSREMMKIGHQKACKAGFEDRITFTCGSAQQMPYEDNSFQAVTCAYGIRNFSELEKGLAEMCRVLAPGGQLVILEFSYPQNPVVKAVYNLYFSHIMPLIGRVMSKDPGAFKYFLGSVKNFIWGEEMAAKLRDAGFTGVRFRTMSFGITTLYTATKE